MIGVLVQLAISWILLWFVEKEHLNVLGVIPTKKRISQLSVGIAIAVVCCVGYFILAFEIESKAFKVNPHFTLISLLKGIYWVLNSVLFEELIFRGALLYIAMMRIGEMKASLLSAICFGVYHWFSFGVWGNPVPMIFVFLMTSIWGFMFAMSFVKTKSLYLPIGLHFGWNFVTIIIFSNGPLGGQFLLITGGHAAEGLVSMSVFVFQVFAMPLVVYWYLRFTNQIASSQSSTSSD